MEIDTKNGRRGFGIMEDMDGDMKVWNQTKNYTRIKIQGNIEKTDPKINCDFANLLLHNY